MLGRTLRPLRAFAVPSRVLLSQAHAFQSPAVVRAFSTARKPAAAAEGNDDNPPASEEIARILATTPDDDDNYSPDIQAIKSVMIDTSDPTKFVAEKHAGLLYTIPEKESRTLFPEGFPGSRPNRPALDERGKPLYPQVEESKLLMPKDLLFSERQIIVRETTLALIAEIMALKDDAAKFSTSRGFVIGGPSGIGKSFTLAHVIHHFRVQDWLVVSVPRAQDWMQRSPEWFPAKGIKGFYDQRDTAVALLNEAKAANEEKLAKLPLRDPESLKLLALRATPATSTQPSNTESTTSPSSPTILELINFGIAEEEQSVNVALKFRDELQHVTEFPVMIAIDEYNAFFAETHYHDKYGKLLPEQMRMVARWREFDGDKLKNGIIVAAVDETLPFSNKLQYRKEFKGEVRLVPKFSTKEMKTLCVSMLQSGQLMVPVDDEIVAFMMMMTSGRPRHAGTVALSGVYL
eukprot:c6833_g1_i1.p1 GENE.c6833_g1_i1~~c6833_g1_i1.p1  ORF type:complete len:462 (-),score=118.53 c6833_g1_i1:209-1594(-)